MNTYMNTDLHIILHCAIPYPDGHHKQFKEETLCGQTVNFLDPDSIHKWVFPQDWYTWKANHVTYTRCTECGSHPDLPMQILGSL